MKRIDIEEAAEYPFYASILPFEDTKYNKATSLIF